MMVADTNGLAALKDDLLAARIAFAVSDEMAMTLEDIVLRRLIEGSNRRAHRRPNRHHCRLVTNAPRPQRCRNKAAEEKRLTIS